MDHFQSLLINKDEDSKTLGDTENGDQLDTIEEEEDKHATAADDDEEREFPVTVALLCTDRDASIVQAFMTELPEIMPMDDFGYEDKTLVWFSDGMTHFKRNGIVDGNYKWQLVAKTSALSDKYNTLKREAVESAIWQSVNTTITLYCKYAHVSDEVGIVVRMETSVQQCDE